MSLASIANTHRVVFERPRVTRDSSGGPVKGSWMIVLPLGEVTGSLQPTSARDRYLLGQRQVFASHSFYAAADLSEVRRDDRLRDLDTDKTYAIVFAADMAGRHRGWKVFVVEQAE